MSSKSGLIVFTATPEMAAQMPSVLEAGVVYVAQRATAVAVGDSPAASSSATKKVTRKKAATKKTKKKITKKATKKPPAKKKKKVTKKQKKVTKKPKKTAKSATVKSTKRNSIKPEIVIQYVRDNEGCNMTDIESVTKVPQTVLRRVLNTARDAGDIRTEGQRRGLRYFAAAGAPKAASDDDTAPWVGDDN